jgi:hypothetical protein
MVLLSHRDLTKSWDKWIVTLAPSFWAYTIMLAFNLTYFTYYNFLFLNACLQDLSRRSFITNMLGDFL